MSCLFRSWESSYPAERLVPYDPAWADRYERVIGDLGRALGPEWEFEHVGSTSIPAMPAKPVIDIALRMPRGEVVAVVQPLVLSAGWSEIIEVGDHAATLLTFDGIRRAIGHLFTAEQWPEAHLRLFASWLRHHADDRRRYADLKMRLVAQGSWGNEYTLSKGSFVREIVDKARAARGLPPAGSL